MDVMKTIFSRILLAQGVTVLLALVVATTITRVNLSQSFKGFLETQERNILQTLVPVFADLYESGEGWSFLRDNPRAWQKIWHLSHPEPGEERRGRSSPNHGGQSDHSGPPGRRQSDFQLLRWMGPPERGIFRDRLFLLDENRNRISGAARESGRPGPLEAIEVDGQVVGWIGFAPLGNVLPPDADRFLAGQIRITVVSFLIALLVAVALAYLLARKVSRPVRQLGVAVKDLSRGNYGARVAVEAGDEMGNLAGHVNQLAESLEKSRTARQRWMADIAHELRTPVAILKGEVEAMADGVRPADERMAVSLQEEIDQLSKLVDDLQTLAMSDAGALNIQRETMDFSGLVLRCVESVGTRLAARAIAVELQVADAIPIQADQRRLRQLVLNLLENCCRYVARGGRVRVILSQSREAIRLTVEDSGPGLEDEQIEHLFERFYRVEDSRSRSGGGSGLGLSICKNIAEAHSGSIQAEASTMGGLKIQVSFPAWMAEK